MTGAAVVALALIVGSASAQTAPSTPPPPGGKDIKPGAATGVGDSPIVGAGSNGNGGVVQGTPAPDAGSAPNAAPPDPKVQNPQLSK